MSTPEEDFDFKCGDKKAYSTTGPIVTLSYQVGSGHSLFTATPGPEYEECMIKGGKG